MAKFIVLEGIDGSGTTTQTNLLKNYLNLLGKEVYITSEPTEGEIGKLIRKALQTDIFSIEDPEKIDQQMAILFAADRHYHLFNKKDGILELLNRGIYVVSTRYYFSSIAYNANNQDDYNWINNLNSHFPKPDILIYINVPVEVSLERISKRKNLEIYEHREKLLKVHSNYLKILDNYSGALINVDGRASIEQIHSSIVKYLEKMI
jgi:dTMP kinase